MPRRPAGQIFLHIAIHIRNTYTQIQFKTAYISVNAWGGFAYMPTQGRCKFVSGRYGTVSLEICCFSTTVVLKLKVEFEVLFWPHSAVPYLCIPIFNTHIRKKIAYIYAKVLGC